MDIQMIRKIDIGMIMANQGGHYCKVVYLTLPRTFAPPWVVNYSILVISNIPHNTEKALFH